MNNSSCASLAESPPITRRCPAAWGGGSGSHPWHHLRSLVQQIFLLGLFVPTRSSRQIQHKHPPREKFSPQIPSSFLLSTPLPQSSNKNFANVCPLLSSLSLPSHLLFHPLPLESPRHLQGLNPRPFSVLLPPHPSIYASHTFLSPLFPVLQGVEVLASPRSQFPGPLCKCSLPAGQATRTLAGPENQKWNLASARGPEHARLTVTSLLAPKIKQRSSYVVFLASCLFGEKQ